MANPQPMQPIDPKELQAALAHIAERSAAVVAKFAESQPHVDFMRNIGDLGIDKAFAELGSKLLADPSKLAQMQMHAWEDYLKLWTAMLSRAQGGQAEPVKQPQKGDNRFRSELWQNNFVFDYIKQSYLIAAEHIQRTVAETGGLDETSARKVKFFTRQYIDALAPTNFAFTNPEVLKVTAETGGRNLLHGLENLLGDLDRGHGKLAISMTDYAAFKLGENVAATPGKVVFQNDLMQLLQFEPTTGEANRTPLLIVPPWINKYYILDLRPSNSFIKWAVDQGHTVFVISWVNPDERLAHKTFHDYLFEGPLAALDAMREATGEPSANVIGYCLGGTLTACLMSWLKARGQSDRVKSVTYFTTMIDFREPGELGVFVDEDTVTRLEKRMEARGFLEGEEMAGTFNLLRDNDLIWSFVVNNYLLGKEPFPFDLLYWNSDATRMPAKMHTFYLRNMYIRNLLIQPGELTVGGEQMDLSQVTTPTYFISTMEDHIAPWKSTYSGARRFSGPVRFVLGGSGHIAGIVNPPAANKYCFWTRPDMPEDAQAWLENADRHEGSWWNDWAGWISSFGGGKVHARKPGDRALRVIEAAPGSYAKARLDGAGGDAAPAAKAAPEPATAQPPAAPVVDPVPAAPAGTKDPAPAPAKGRTARSVSRTDSKPAAAKKAVGTPRSTPKPESKPGPKKAAVSTAEPAPKKAPGKTVKTKPAERKPDRKKTLPAAAAPAAVKEAPVRHAKPDPGAKPAPKARSASTPVSTANAISALFREQVKAARSHDPVPAPKKAKSGGKKNGKAKRKDR
ncbi:MAG: class I poly(R)-hydroxyalkanoic acid synthase [Betaproteobacteria bacterium]|nr:class I poly(R)-hydroxyalkanoic acid synthase [Betaproteobacteria bacterium]